MKSIFETLEFDKVLSYVAEFAISEMGKALCFGASVFDESEIIKKELALTNEAKQILDKIFGDTEFPLQYFHDTEKLLGQVTSSFDIDEILAVVKNLRVARLVDSFLEQNSNFFPHLVEGRENLYKNKFFEEKESKPRPTKGENINMTIEITPKEAIDGVVKKINIVHSEKCPKCLGKKFANGTKCTNCDGSGEITIRKKVTVRIPKNPKQNSTLKIKNEGKLGKFGAESGDLILTIKIASKNVFKIENNRAKLELPITPWEAFLGSDILIPTMDGNVTMKIPPQTNSHDKFKITGGGPLNKKTGKREDLIVEIKIVTPQKPTIEEIRAYKEIKNLDGSKIRNELFE